MRHKASGGIYLAWHYGTVAVRLALVALGGVSTRTTRNESGEGMKKRDTDGVD